MSGASEVRCGANQVNIYSSEASAIIATLLFALHYPSSSVGDDRAVTNLLVPPALKLLGRHSFYIELACLSPRTLGPSYICTPHTVSTSHHKTRRIQRSIQGYTPPIISFSIVFRYPASRFFTRNFRKLIADLSCRAV
jgi:hypothetical protein